MSGWIVLALIIGVPVGLYFLYAFTYMRILENTFDAYLAQYSDPNRTETWVIRTDGLFPVLGRKPPDSAMWRVRSGLYAYKGNLIPTYRYDPEQLENADLD